MNTSVKSTLPRKDFTAITQLGLKALSLALTHADSLVPRLPEGMIELLSNDIEKLGKVVPGAKQARSEAVAATSAQNVTLERGYAQARQIRAALRRAHAPADVKRAYGVGQKVKKTNVRDVKVAIRQILDRAKEHPAEAASLGIQSKDLDGLAQALVEITNADAIQEQKRASAPLATQERNRMGHRILRAVGRIEGAGRMEFANDEATRASFEALSAGSRKKKRAAENGGEAAPSMGGPPS
ncbi:hypothetical protein [Polyangium sp. 15x6]|uniref:hypothetical protein n=1 Tax=Polyangium sp. 15x6 TaxID=3042687 RepID=UPI00249B8A29|nr:hypothetical protein [Polyangium sp. 15x6]MDI3283570.1 hypothetical protein [Polyangium sp. 15x6]